jgi:hypothetical protein
MAVGEFAPVDVRVASVGGGKRAEALRNLWPMCFSVVKG